MNKALKIITIIGVLCMLVPFMVLGTFASAEEVIVTDNSTSYLRSLYSQRQNLTSGATGYQLFDDGGYFSLTFPTLSSNFFDLSDVVSGFTGISGVLSVNDLSFDLPFINAGFKFLSSSVSSRYIEWTNYNSVLHYYVLALLSIGSSPTSSMFSFNGTNGISTDVNNLSHSYAEFSYVGFNEEFQQYEYQLTADDTLHSYSFAFSYTFYTSQLYDVDLYNDTLNFSFITWQGVPSANLLRATSSYSNTYIVGLFDLYSIGNGYEEGVNAGKQQGYDEGFTAGEQQGYNQGVADGKYQANNTVNTGSASYIKGYQDGLDAPEYSFMSLISSIIDAPIRAFFGFTENGVTHPGLFNFNILGYDMSNLVLSIFSLCVLITILRLILGGK